MGAFSKKIGVAGAAAGLALAPLSSAAETGWQLTGTASESLSISDSNASSLTRIGISAISETERLRFGINAGAGLSATKNFNSTGAGWDFDVVPNLGVSLGVDGKRWTLSSEATASFEPITFIEDIDEVDLTTSDETGIRRSIGASVRGTYDLTPRSSASLSYSYRNVDYSNSSEDFVPSQTHTISAAINYAALDDTSIVASVGARWFDTTNMLNSSSFTLDTNVRVSYEATSRLSLDAGAGVTWATSRDDVLGLRTETTSTALLINGGLSYGLRDGTIRLNLSQRVAPEASSGELTRFNTATLGYTHQLNQRTALGLDLSVSDQKTIPRENSITQVSISPFLSWELYEDVQARVGYSWSDHSENGVTHRVTFLVQKSFQSGF